MPFRAFVACGLFVAFSAGLGKAGDYARAELLVEAASLAQPEFASRVRVLDVRPWRTYDSRHIPGAVWVDLDAWTKAFREGRERRFWEKEIGALGIDLDTPVIVYDRGSGESAAQTWWILRYWGVRDVRLLNAGWFGWLWEGKAQVRDVPTVEARPVQLEPQAGRLAVKQQVLEQLQTGWEQIIDVRSLREFKGEKTTALRAGSIPSARHLDWTSPIATHRWSFKSTDDLNEVLRASNINPDRPAIIYGRSGDDAALLAFSLELLGARYVRIYYRGWEEWGNVRDTPVSRHTR
jgi:thiosulfate/3-mercaptopyruvate sulfurtransferase